MAKRTNLRLIAVSIMVVLIVAGSAQAFNGRGLGTEADPYFMETKVLEGLEIAGLDGVAENSSALYKAIAYYDNDSTTDVTDLAVWSVDPNDIADVNAGLLTTEMVDLPMDITITAQYSEGEFNGIAEKNVSIFAICPAGSALEFDGVDDYVEVADNVNNRPGTSDWSVLLWFWAPDKPQASTMISKRVTTYPYNQFSIAIGDHGYHNNPGKKLQLAIIGTSGLTDVWWYYTPDIVDGNWHHVAAVRNQTGGKIYVDGISQTLHKVDGNRDSDTEPQDINNTRPWIIGNNGKNKYFKGSIDEVAIYKSALSAEEIQGLMHTRPDVDDSSLVAYWDFDEGSDQVAGDSAGGNDGTLGSGPDIDGNDPKWIDSDAPVGICSEEEIVERKFSDVWNTKLNILEQLYEAMAQEEALWEYMDMVFKDRDFGNTSKGDVVKAKQKIHSAIQHEEQAETAVDQSLDKLGDALDALDIELNMGEE